MIGMVWDKRLRWSQSYAVGAVILALAVFAVYGNTLSAFWRFDDGYHLKSAAMFKPWYFLVPEIVRQTQGGNAAPWNPFVYSINLWMFGLSPRWFYLHHLMSLWAACMATFVFLRLWVSSILALLASTLFLLGAPTMHVSQELMCGHYLDGLTFSVIALIFYIHAVRKNRISLSISGAFFYALAMLSKEVYVPLIAVLPFIPEGDRRTRRRVLIPYAALALAYPFWRRFLLGRWVGGYEKSFAGGPQLSELLDTLARIPTLLFGSDAAGLAVALAFAAGIALCVIFRHRALLFVAVMVATLSPLLPLVHWPRIVSPDRYLFAAWWGLCVAFLLSIKALVRNSAVLMVMLGVLIGAVALHTWRDHKGLARTCHHWESLYLYAINSTDSQVLLLPHDPNDPTYFPSTIGGLIAADRAINRTEAMRAQLIEEAELSSLDLAGRSLWRYDAQCNCGRDVTAEAPDIIRQQNKLRSLQRTIRHVWEHGDLADHRVQARDRGYIDRITVFGTELAIEGWVKLADEETGQTITLIVPDFPASSSVKTVLREDVARHFGGQDYECSGFTITLRFQNHRGAVEAAETMLIGASSDQTPLGLLDRGDRRSKR